MKVVIYCQRWPHQDPSTLYFSMTRPAAVIGSKLVRIDVNLPDDDELFVDARVEATASDDSGQSERSP